jgi:plastocyanin
VRVVLAALCLAVAGCGDHASPAPVAKRPATPAVVQVEMHGNRFRPHDITVRLGQTVRWTNGDAEPHTVASKSLKLASDAIRPGAAFTYKPARAGTFRYFCTIHFGQTGRLVVRG